MSSPERLPKTFQLSNGASIPVVGYGTFQSSAGNDNVKKYVLFALSAGYRHIDTATAYGNETQVGEALKESGIAREDLFITTKLAQPWHRPGDVEQAMDESLQCLGLDYVDLFLMHFPQAYLPGPNHSTIRHPSGNGKPVIDYETSRDYPSTWKAMEALIDKGKAKAIGLSNFNILKTKRILQMARIKPTVNQVELHPYLPQTALLEFLAAEGIHAIAHQPLGGAPVGVVALNNHIPGPLHDRLIRDIARKLQITTAQVLLSWAVQRGTTVIPKSAQEQRIQENLLISKLPQSDFEAISNLKDAQSSIRYMDPKIHVGFDIFSEDGDEPTTNHVAWD